MHWSFGRQTVLDSTEAARARHDVRVRLGDRSYTIRILSNAAEQFGAFARGALEATWGGAGCRRCLIVTDEHVREIAAVLGESLAAAGIAPEVSAVPPGEESKSLGTAAGLWDTLVRLRADRHTAVVAVGGGVVGDLAGFVAATYARGLPLLMVPTSLLAQVDSSVGGKVGINHPEVKNIIGAFHQPAGVWIDTDVLETLPPREFHCGLAEVVKYGVILDAPFFGELETGAPDILAREPTLVRRIVARSCELKASVVERDELEWTGLRAVLNFGHTVAHAVESVAGYSDAYHHGEAVSIGMVAESRIAEELGWLDACTRRRLERLLSCFGLPTAAPELDTELLLEAMTHDKKNRAGSLRFVLPRRLGHVELTDVVTPDRIRRVLVAP
jgi:3-dehydroquinate synthase